ncbi:hypothetical protein A2975_01000 [Candidatus Woesebacteria bacterium RIFCSPLOWO2_01_FULL_44_14]|uniref:SpoVT-AbrB domain-containing protein n=1 Tax=Candidatus Woesebacteria bacterium RIFCSPLOWO2_01_FULL_44_14 TaxID=1802525 RepID=A0A1F8BZZ9_9BACT|nr:MAG: hypothetical protein A2975_01000 [Candidatus Woesebacteria bacterium RIFCSPLOWO2_01_FULL_44_14]
MLLPRIVDVSDKGQILIPVDMRRAFGIKPKSWVYIVPDKKKKKLAVEPIGKDLIGHLRGILADVDPGRSWAQELVEERRRDLIREETKFDTLFKKKK